jgi:hypothetical protein
MLFVVPYHMNAICIPLSHAERYIQSHNTWMLFSVPYHINAICTNAPYSEFRKDDLLMVNLPKHVTKVKKIKINAFIVLFDWNLKLFVAFLFSNTTECPLQNEH